MSDVALVMVAAFAGELLLVLLVLLLIAWLRNRAAMRRDTKAMRVLVTRIKNAKSERETEIGSFLGERMGLAGEPLEQAKVAIQRAELTLLQRFAGVYKKRDAGAAAQFDIDVVAAVAPYFSLQGTPEAQVAEQLDDSPSEMAALRAENTRLSEELSVTMETMSRMLNEYSTMFAGGSPDAAARIGALTGAVAGLDEQAEPGPETQQTPPMPEPEDEFEVDIVAAVEAQADKHVEAAAEVEAESELAVDPDAGAEVAAEDDVDVLVESVGEVDAEADEQDARDLETVEQDDIDALFAAESHEDLVNVIDPDDELSAAAGTTDAEESMQTASPAIGVPEASGEDQEINKLVMDEESMDEAPALADDLVAAQIAGTADLTEDLVGPDQDLSVAPDDSLAAEDAAAEPAPGPVAGVPDPSSDPRHAAMDAVSDPVPETAEQEVAMVDLEAGDDLESISDLFDEGAVDVVAFDESSDLDVPLAVSEDDLFDAVDSETIVRADAALDEPADGVEDTAMSDADNLFDAADEQRKAQSGQ